MLCLWGNACARCAAAEDSACLPEDGGTEHLLLVGCGQRRCRNGQQHSEALMVGGAGWSNT